MDKEEMSFRGRLIGLEKRLFLVDGVGALLSATLIGGVLASFPEVVGAPRKELLLLALPAVVFAIYSFSCYQWSGTRWRSFLRVIGWANIAYCLLTITFMYVYFESLTLAGMVYFVLEIVVVLELVSIELRAANGNAR